MSLGLRHRSEVTGCPFCPHAVAMARTEASLCPFPEVQLLSSAIGHSQLAPCLESGESTAVPFARSEWGLGRERAGCRLSAQERGAQ